MMSQISQKSLNNESNSHIINQSDINETYQIQISQNNSKLQQKRQQILQHEPIQQISVTHQQQQKPQKDIQLNQFQQIQSSKNQSNHSIINTSQIVKDEISNKLTEQILNDRSLLKNDINEFSQLNDESVIGNKLNENLKISQEKHENNVQQQRQQSDLRNQVLFNESVNKSNKQSAQQHQQQQQQSQQQKQSQKQQNPKDSLQQMNNSQMLQNNGFVFDDNNMLDESKNQIKDNKSRISQSISEARSLEKSAYEINKMKEFSQFKQPEKMKDGMDQSFERQEIVDQNVIENNQNYFDKQNMQQHSQKKQHNKLNSYHNQFDNINQVGNQIEKSIFSKKQSQQSIIQQAKKDEDIVHDRHHHQQHQFQGQDRQNRQDNDDQHPFYQSQHFPTQVHKQSQKRVETQFVQQHGTNSSLKLKFRNIELQSSKANELTEPARGLFATQISNPSFVNSKLSKIREAKQQKKRKLLEDLNKLNEQIRVLDKKQDQIRQYISPQKNFVDRVKINDNMEARKKALSLVKNLQKDKKQRNMQRMQSLEKIDQNINSYMSELTKIRSQNQKKLKQKKKIEIIDRMKKKQLLKINQYKKIQASSKFVSHLQKFNEARQQHIPPIKPASPPLQQNIMSRKQTLSKANDYDDGMTPELANKKQYLNRVRTLSQKKQRGEVENPYQQRLN